MIRNLGLLLVATLGTSPVVAQTKPLVELGDGKGNTYQGRVESLQGSSITLMQRDGQIRFLDRRGVKNFSKVASRFRPYSRDEFRESLTEEFGRAFTMKNTQHFVVCVPPKTKTNYAAIFENVYRAFDYQFRRRSFRPSDPEFPLVAIVFPTFSEFAKYAAKDGVRATPTLRGYYSRVTNRVAVFERQRTAMTTPSIRTGQLAVPDEGWAFASEDFDSGTVADLTSTITHETIHQVSFNTGIHPRLGNPPKWIVEGLAMTFESPGFLATSGAAKGSTRINRDRFVWFRNFQQSRRQNKSLRRFIQSDDLFRAQALDSYSQAWALTFFFMDQPSRSHKFGKYLREMESRDLTKPYSSADRVADFELAFGDIDRVEVEFLRFMERLKL